MDRKNPEIRRIGLDLSSLSGERARRGIGTYALNLTRELLNLLRERQGQGLKFYFFVFTDRAELEKLVGELPEGVKVVTIPGRGKGRLKTLLGHQLGLMFLAARYRLDILHSFGYGVDPSQPGIPPLLPFCGRIVTVHDFIPLHYPQIFLNVTRKRLWYKLMLRRVARSRHIFTNSEHTRQEVIAQLKVDPNRVSCPSLSADQLTKYEETSLSPDRAASYNEDISADGAASYNKPFVLCVSGPQPHKNLENLVKAFVEWQKEADEACLVVTGAGVSAEGLKRLLPPHLQNSVLWFNNLEEKELVELYRSARFLAFPSLYEGFGLPVLEAMTLGCPVLCSNSAALSGVAANAALLVNPLDINDITKGLARLWDDDKLRAKLKEAGLLRAKDFSWRRTAELTLAKLREEL